MTYVIQQRYSLWPWTSQTRGPQLKPHHISLFKLIISELTAACQGNGFDLGISQSGQTQNLEMWWFKALGIWKSGCWVNILKCQSWGIKHFTLEVVLSGIFFRTIICVCLFRPLQGNVHAARLDWERRLWSRICWYKTIRWIASKYHTQCFQTWTLANDCTMGPGVQWESLWSIQMRGGACIAIPPTNQCAHVLSCRWQ